MSLFIRKEDGKPLSLLELFLFVQTLMPVFILACLALGTFLIFPEFFGCKDLSVEGIRGMSLYDKFLVLYPLFVVTYNIRNRLIKYVLRKSKRL